MEKSLEFIGTTFAIGIGATMVLDLWAVFLRKAFGVQGLNYALLGRWVGHMAQGKFHHQNIATARPTYNEAPLGWALHYGIGVLFAAVLLLVFGLEWAARPILFPALVVGVGSIVAPFFVMQPAFGMGIAASKTAAPFTARLKGLITHTVFGAGLYVAALVVAAL